MGVFVKGFILNYTCLNATSKVSVVLKLIHPQPSSNIDQNPVVYSFRPNSQNEGSALFQKTIEKCIHNSVVFMMICIMPVSIVSIELFIR